MKFEYIVDASSGNCISIKAPMRTWALVIRATLRGHGFESRCVGSTVTLQTPLTLAQAARWASPDCVKGKVSAAKTVPMPPTT